MYLIFIRNVSIRRCWRGLRILYAYISLVFSSILLFGNPIVLSRNLDTTWIFYATHFIGLRNYLWVFNDKVLVGFEIVLNILGFCFISNYSNWIYIWLNYICNCLVVYCWVVELWGICSSDFKGGKQYNYLLMVFYVITNIRGILSASV